VTTVLRPWSQPSNFLGTLTVRYRRTISRFQRISPKPPPEYIYRLNGSFFWTSLAISFQHGVIILSTWYLTTPPTSKSSKSVTDIHLLQYQHHRHLSVDLYGLSQDRTQHRLYGRRPRIKVSYIVPVPKTSPSNMQQHNQPQPAKLAPLTSPRRTRQQNLPLRPGWLHNPSFSTTSAPQLSQSSPTYAPSRNIDVVTP
jgi:hypothetical protein